MAKHCVKLSSIKKSLSKEQKVMLSEALETLMVKYRYLDANSQNNYFTGVVEGLNDAWKMVNGIDDDYNTTL